MSRPGVKWKDVKRCFRRLRFTIYSKGGDKFIQAPEGWHRGNGRRTVRIGHKCCARDGDEVTRGYLKLLERSFGVTRDEMLDA